MGKRIYRTKTHTTIKVRLQHTDPSGEISPLLEALSETIDACHKDKLVAFNRPRLGTNPKYEGQQATAMYLELDYDVLRFMFSSLAVLREEYIPA